jgi:hypothetical protein
MVSAVPAGFRAGASGLLLPEAQSRVRTTLTWPEWRALEKATALLTDARMAAEWVMRCENTSCPDRKIERVRVPGGLAFQCGCRTREFLRSL